MSLKEIDKNIKTITTNAAKLNRLIHDTAMMISRHALDHGDCTRALTLVKAMPASMRRTMLVLWFDTFTPIRVVISNDRVGMAKEGSKMYKPFDLEAGEATPFYELAEQNPEANTLDFDKIVALVASLAKRIEKKIESGDVKDEDVPSARAVAAQISALKFAKIKPNNDVVEAEDVNLKVVNG